MRKKGLALCFCAAVMLLANPIPPAQAQRVEAPLPPAVDRDCSESEQESCHLHVGYSYTSLYFIEDSVQETRPKPGSQHDKTRRLHELKLFTKAVPRRLMREAQLEEGSETSAAGEARSYHDVFLSYVLGDYVNGEKRYVEQCTSRNDGSDFHGERIFKIEQVGGKEIDGWAIMSRRVGGADNVDYTRFRPATESRGEGNDFVDAFKDRTRCGSAAFPFQMARDPNLKPPPE